MKYIAPILLVLAVFSLVSLIPRFNNQVVCANTISCTKNMQVDIENGISGTFMGQKVTPPSIDLIADASTPSVLGDNTATGDKHIYIDLTNQTLTAYQGDNLFLKTLVSTGKWHPTPTGDFKIWVKLRATRMTGGSGADYYDLPNVPYVMFFANNQVPESAGFSLHGAYWHDNFGHAMSHGCVNMRTVDAEKIYNWISDSELATTTITIYGEAL